MTRLEEIRTRLEAATPGPWEQCRPSGEYVQNPKTNFNVCMTRRSLDAAFIANCPDDISYLLAEVERLETENKSLQVDVKVMRNNLRNALEMEGEPNHEQTNE